MTKVPKWGDMFGQIGSNAGTSTGDQFNWAGVTPTRPENSPGYVNPNQWITPNINPINPNQTYGGSNWAGRTQMQPDNPPEPSVPPIPGITPDINPVDPSPTYQNQAQSAGTYQWTDWSPESQANLGTDQWYRNPSWGGHVVWNPNQGWQDWATVENAYAGGTQGSLTAQQGDDWRQYFADRPVMQEQEGWYNDPVKGWTQGVDPRTQQGICGQAGIQPVGQTQYINQGGQAPPGQQPQTGGFQYPSQWNTASDVLTQFAQGLPTQQPWQWQQGSDIASQMAQTGMPTSYEPMYQQAKSIAQRDTTAAIKQAAEQAGLSGMRWSTPLGQTAQRIAGENMANLGLGFAGQEMGALEAASGRQMGGVDQLYGFGQGTTGLTEAAKNRGMQAAGGLTGLGQQYLNAPQDWAAQMYQMGGGMQQQAQSGLDRYMQDYMRMSPEYNPWVNQGMSYWGTPSQMGYQQYNPSAMSQIGGLASGLGMLGLGLCGN